MRANLTALLLLAFAVWSALGATFPEREDESELHHLAKRGLMQRIAEAAQAFRDGVSSILDRSWTGVSTAVKDMMDWIRGIPPQREDPPQNIPVQPPANRPGPTTAPRTSTVPPRLRTTAVSTPPTRNRSTTQIKIQSTTSRPITLTSLTTQGPSVMTPETTSEPMTQTPRTGQHAGAITPWATNGETSQASETLAPSSTTTTRTTDVTSTFSRLSSTERTSTLPTNKEVSRIEHPESEYTSTVTYVLSTSSPEQPVSNSFVTSPRSTTVERTVSESTTPSTRTTPMLTTPSTVALTPVTGGDSPPRATFTSSTVAIRSTTAATTEGTVSLTTLKKKTGTTEQRFVHDADPSENDIPELQTPSTPRKRKGGNGFVSDGKF